MAMPQPDGGVRIKVRDDQHEGVQERRGLWKLWRENLPKRRLKKPKGTTKYMPPEGDSENQEKFAARTLR